MAKYTGRHRYNPFTEACGGQVVRRATFPPHQVGIEDYMDGENRASVSTALRRLATGLVGDSDRTAWNYLRSATGPDGRIGRFVRAGGELLERHAQLVKKIGAVTGSAAVALAFKPLVGLDLSSPFQAATEFASKVDGQTSSVAALSAVAVVAASTGRHFANKAAGTQETLLVPNGLDLVCTNETAPEGPAATMQPASTVA